MIVVRFNREDRAGEGYVPGNRRRQPRTGWRRQLRHGPGHHRLQLVHRPRGVRGSGGARTSGVVARGRSPRGTPCRRTRGNSLPRLLLRALGRLRTRHPRMDADVGFAPRADQHPPETEPTRIIVVVAEPRPDSSRLWAKRDIAQTTRTFMVQPSELGSERSECNGSLTTLDTCADRRETQHVKCVRVSSRLAVRRCPRRRRRGSPGRRRRRACLRRRRPSSSRRSRRSPSLSRPRRRRSLRSR